MKILILLTILLTGCATSDNHFVSSDHSNDPWGNEITKELYNSNEIIIQSKLTNINTTVHDGYRLDKETWKLFVINNSNNLKCINVNIKYSGFNVKLLKPNPIKLLPNSLLNIALLFQTTKYKKIMGFEFLGISRAMILVSEC